jgi:hypothetical protein
MFPRLLAATALVLLSGPAWGQASLATLRKAHPRLIALDSDIDALRTLIEHNPQAHDIYQRLIASAEKMQAAEPAKHRLIGPRLLDQSRLALHRVYTLGLLYRLNHEPRYRDRALKELRAVAAFPDWNPSHFLDTAEMTHAVAIGYDWFYPELSQADRKLLRDAIVQKGLDPALKVHAEGGWWTSTPFNWNQVCNGGITIGALAVAEDEPDRAERLLRYAVKSIPLAFESYAPDGGWAEGPAYWNYATNYTVYFLAALDSALGTDFGLSNSQGFDRAGEFRIYSTGPTERTFNYADADGEIEPAPALFWLARRFQQPAYAGQQLRMAAPHADAFDLLWFPEKTSTPAQANWPLDKIYKGVQVAYLRSSWKDPNALWAAIKGGDNKANHSHLDLGSFEVDALGVRWATDLGSDEYNLPQYFGPLRFTYYRLRTESHNTVLIDGENQDEKAAAPIVGSILNGESPSVTIDLTAAYPGRLRKHTREIQMPQRSAVTIRERIEAAQPVEALWGMVTAADVTLNGREAVLSLAGKRMLAKIETPSDARFEIISTQPPQPQRQNEGTRKLAVRLPAKVQSLDLTLTLKPRP